jgi:hypothetical protein
MRSSLSTHFWGPSGRSKRRLSTLLDRLTSANRHRSMRRRLRSLHLNAEPALEQLESRILLSAVTTYDGNYAGSFSGTETHTDQDGTVTVTPIPNGYSNLFTALISNGTFTASDPGVGGISTGPVNAQGQVSGTGTALNVFGQRFPLVFSGSAQAASTGFTFSGTFSWDVVQSGSTDVGQGAWTLQPINPPALPILHVPAVVTVNAANLVAFNGANAISVTDAAGSGNNEQLTLSVNNGTLTLVPTSGSQVFGSGTQIVTITGSLLQVNADLTNLIYVPNPGSPVSDTLTATVVDTTDQAQGASAQVSITPDYLLQEATEPNPHEISLTYDVMSNSLTQLPLDVYRSPVAEPSTLVNEIANVVISNPQDLTPGEHNNVIVNLNGAVLSIDPSEEFVDVVGNPDANGQSTGPDHEVYFQKFVLGVATHGFASDGTVPAWLPQLSCGLQQAGYNQVIEFTWVLASLKPKSRITVSEGSQMASQIKSAADSLVTQQGVAPGSVVDLHLIGHSRGSVVISQAMLNLVSTTDPALVGGFKEMTFLDPHPASSADQFLSAAKTTKARIELALYNGFVSRTQDPAVVIPSNVNEAEVYYQQNPVSVFPASSGESTLNLWGDIRDITNQSTIAVSYFLLNNDTLSNGSPIGHSEVPLWYLQNVVPNLDDSDVTTLQTKDQLASPAALRSPTLASPSSKSGLTTVLAIPNSVSAPKSPLNVFGHVGDDAATESVTVNEPIYLFENATGDNIQPDLGEEAIEWAGLNAALESLNA